MTDVRDMLGVSGGAGHGRGVPVARSSPHPSSAAASHTHSHSASPSPAPPSNVSRELQQLRSEFNWGASSLPIAPSVGAQAFKAKRAVKAVSWKLLPIRSSARCQATDKDVDDVDLYHWVKIHHVPDYRFARFNKPIKFLQYSEDEYRDYLQDASWSRAETDRLMRLARCYDLRFIIMQDRYNMEVEEEERKWKEKVEEKGMEMSKGDKKHGEEALKAFLSKTNEQLKASTSQPASSAAAATSGQAAGDASAQPMDISPQSDAATSSAAAASAAQSSAASTSSPSSPTTDLSHPTTVALPSVSIASPPTSIPAADGAAASTSSIATSSAASSSVSASTSSASSASLTATSTTSTTSLSSSTSSSSSPLFRRRSVEELKTRFYSIQQSLLLLRNASDGDVRKTHPLFTHQYDPAHEMLRKEQLERLYKRTQKEVDDMAEIVLEHRNITNMIKKLKKKGSAVGGTVGVTKEELARAGTKATKGSRDKTPAGTVVSTKKKGVKRAPLPQVVGELAPIPENCDASAIIPSRPPGVYLRSTQLIQPLSITPRQQKLLDAELNALNIKKHKDLTVATGVVCDLWDKLRVNIITLANLQGYVRERETMRDDLRAHSISTTASSSALPPAAPTSHRKKTGEKRRMEGDTEQDDKRPRKVK